ncbi:MAG TPA: competence/damage-inducible protein A [Clostridiaceae bacterium]|nr:competence/damage-inducible protein A [Clostridiaceae bacterium]
MEKTNNVIIESNVNHNKSGDILIESAEIVAVGTELLIGQTLNTNTYYLANQLTLLGINSYYQSVVGDNPERLLGMLQTALTRADLVITSGGLGPTADDVTMELIAKAAGKELVLDPVSKQSIIDYFTGIGRTVSDNNWKQAMMPQGAITMPNNNGTAPGAILVFDYDGKKKAIACLPGPPGELKLMFEQSLKPWLEQRVNYEFEHRFLHMIGIGESNAELEIRDLIERQTNPTIAPYASPGEVCFRITQRKLRGRAEADLISPVVAEIKNRLGQYIYEDGTRTLPEIVFALLKEKNQTISFAESCTAGMVSAEFGSIAGISEVFAGSVISYSNNVKEQILGVPSAILQQYGAVSKECAKSMASGVRKSLNTDLAISVTGIAGPDGGTQEKPVGTVYIGADYKGQLTFEKHMIRGNREKIRAVASLRAFHLAWRCLKEKSDN